MDCNNRAINTCVHSSHGIYQNLDVLLDVLFNRCGVSLANILKICIRNVSVLIFFLTIAYQNINAQNTQSFETYGGSLTNLRNDCWTAQGFSFLLDNSIHGSYVVRSSPLSGFVPVSFGSPWVKFNGTGSITVKHKTSNTTSTPKLLVKLVNKSTGLTTTILTHNYAGTALVTSTIPISVTGIYRMIFEASGIGGTGSSRVVVDDISFAGTDLGDRTNNPGNLGLCECIPLGPVPVNDNTTVLEDQSVVTNVIANDTDPDNNINPASLNIITAPSRGIASFNTSGEITYTPQANYFGSDALTYEICDADNVCAQATLTIAVTSVNDIPTAQDDNATTSEDNSIVIAVLANDLDIEGDILTPTIFSTPSHGNVLVQGDGTLIYTPQNNYYGPDNFTYYVNDGTNNSATATVDINITPINDAPNSVDDVIVTLEDLAATVNVLSNDNDIDNSIDASSLVIVTQPLHGTTSINTTTGEVTYVPFTDYYGADIFTYSVKDISGATSNITTVTVSVLSQNDVPIAVDDNVSTFEDVPVIVALLLNDIDVDNILNPSSITIVSAPTHGTLSVNTPNGQVMYSPAIGFLGNDSFTYNIHDENGSISNTGTVVIIINPVNDPPVAVDDGPIVHQSGTALNIDVLINDYDTDNSVNELTIISFSQPTLGTVVLVNGQFVYQPTSTTPGNDSFTYTIQDPSGLTDEAIVTIVYEYSELKVSEGFSPNSDGSNDTWYIRSIESFPLNNVKIYNRWGLLVYEGNKYDNANILWDGRANRGMLTGKSLDRGTYYYVLSLGQKLPTLAGYVDLLR